jgi:hypothetical protein
MTRTDPDATTPTPGVIRDERGRITKGSKRIPGNGKKLGSPYRAMNWDVKALCEEAGFNPFQAMIQLAQTARSEKIQYQARAELMKYAAPQLKSVDLKTEAAQRVVFTWASNPAEIPTLDADGNTLVEHRPEIEVDPPSGIVEEIWQEIVGDDDADDQP